VILGARWPWLEGGRLAVLRAGRRQREVLSRLARGWTDKQIAADLGISVATVRTYLIRLYRDNGFDNRTEAAVAWQLESTLADNGE
jgi:DNA-binding NarL/FixJ family response regulator